jgi:hypothetical protein
MSIFIEQMHRHRQDDTLEKRFLGNRIEEACNSWLLGVFSDPTSLVKLSQSLLSGRRKGCPNHNLRVRLCHITRHVLIRYLLGHLGWCHAVTCTS